MMTSSGSGPYRGGGLGALSSSSNLSPLAAPFRVDKSVPKQTSTNPPASYPEIPMYDPCFDPGNPLWKHSSSATGLSFTETESNRIHTTCSSSPAVYGFSGDSQPSANVGSVYHGASGSETPYDLFSYGPFSNPAPTASKEGVNSFYSTYAPPPPQKDGYLSLAVSSENNFDLSNSSTARLGGYDGSSVSDHLQGRSGDGHNKQHWGSFWSGMNEQESWLEYAQGFGSKEKQLDLLSSKSPFLVGGVNKSQPSVVVHSHPLADGSGDEIPDGGNKSNLKQDGCFDIFGGAYCLGNLGIDQQDSRSLLDCSRLPTAISSLLPKERSHLQDPNVQPVTNFCGFQNANGSSSGPHFNQNDFYVFGSTSNTSICPITKNKSPYGESSPSSEGTFSVLEPIHKDSVGGLEANQSNIFSRLEYSCPVEPHIPVEVKRQSRIVIRRPPSSSLMPSSSSRQVGESMDNGIGSKDDKGQVSIQMPSLFSSDGADLEVDDAQATYSVDKLSGGFDVHTPAEDSPCWKGASLNRFSPFAVSEVVAPGVFSKKLDEWKSLNTQVSQIKSCHVETSDCRDFLSEKGKDGNLIERPLVSECVLKDNEERGYAIRQPFSIDLNAGDGHQLFPGITLAVKRIYGEMEIPSPGQMSEAVVSEGSEKFPTVVANDSFDVPSSSENNHASIPPGDTASLKHCQGASKILNTNIDINMLLKAMTNLSEIFRSYCFNKRASAPEQHSIAIKRIIANLNASMLMMAGGKSSTTLSPEASSLKKDLPDAQMVKDVAFEALAAAVKLGGTTDGLLDSVSFMDGPHTTGDGNVPELQTLKKILHENFNVEGKMDQQKALYKSLWFDAEASLCAMTAKARFLRVKAAMGWTHDGAKDGEIPSSSNNFGDVHRMVEQASCCIDSSVLKECQKSSATSKTNDTKASELPEANKCHIPHTEDVTMKFVDSEQQNQLPSLHTSKPSNTCNDSVSNAEAAFMARYQILKSRIESYEAPSQESKESSSVGHKDPSSLYASGFDSYSFRATHDAIETEDPVLANYQSLNCRGIQDSLNERNSPPGEDNNLPDRESSSLIYEILDSEADNSDSLYKSGGSQYSQLLSNSVGVLEAGEASVMGRFRILQTRNNHSDTGDKDQILISPVKVREDKPDELGLLGQQISVLKSAFGPYPELNGDEDEDEIQFDVGVHKETYLNQCKSTGLNGQIFEGWYANDNRSSSDWEHVSTEDLRPPN